MEEKFQKVCAICDRLFMTDDERRDTCVGCSYKPMYSDGEAANEALAH